MTRVAPRRPEPEEDRERRLDQRTIAHAALLLGLAMAIDDDNPEGADAPADSDLIHDA